MDIKKLLSGANHIRQSFFKDGYVKNILLKKAYFYAQFSKTYNINTVFSYGDCFEDFNNWYIQLWAESLGKKQLTSAFNVGLTPIGLIGPKDQHSFLQTILEGIKDKTVTIIKIANFEFNAKIPNIKLNELSNLDIINGLSFNDFINIQADTITENLMHKSHIPLDEIIIDAQDEFNIGKLIYYYQILTSLVGNLLNIYTYNQPAVEQSKQILIKKINEQNKIK